MEFLIVINFLFQFSGTVTYLGMFPELLFAMQRDLDFDIFWTSPEDGQWGILDENGKWNGIVEVLRTKKADIAASGLTFSSIRGKVIDFTIGVIDDPITIVKLKPNGEELNFTAYFHIFTQSAWIMIIIGIVILAAAMKCIADFLKQEMHPPQDPEQFRPLNALG